MLSFANQELCSYRCSCHRVVVWITNCCTRSRCEWSNPSVQLVAKASRSDSLSLVEVARALEAHSDSCLSFEGTLIIEGGPALTIADNFRLPCWFERGTEKKDTKLLNNIACNMMWWWLTEYFSVKSTFSLNFMPNDSAWTEAMALMAYSACSKFKPLMKFTPWNEPQRV